jgi:chromosome segregation ATPase
MGFEFGKALRSVAGTFVEIDDKPAAPAKQSPVTPTMNVSNQATSIQSTSYDPSMLETLQKQIMARTSPYTTLLEQSAKLSDVLPDENLRLKAAFRMISADGQRSVSSIAQAIDVHVTDLEGARMRFKQATEQQIHAKSGMLRDQAANLEKQAQKASQTIEQLQAQIQSLTNDTLKNNQTINELNTQASQAEAEIVATADAFERTVDYLKSDLQNKKVSLTSVLA